MPYLSALEVSGVFTTRRYTNTRLPLGGKESIAIMYVFVPYNNTVGININFSVKFLNPAYRNMILNA